MGILELFSLEGKAAFVTGAARGIGRALAQGLAEAGARVAIVDIDEGSAHRTSEELVSLGFESMAICVDVTRKDQVSGMVAQVLAQWGRLDIAVNNAGTCRNVPAEEMSEDDWDVVVDLDLKAVFLCAQAAGKVMIGQKSGSIINIASMSAKIVNFPQPQASYNAAKAGVVHLTRSMAAEWAQHGVRVNSISPGYTATDLLRPAQRLHPTWIGLTPMKRFAEPWELAGIAVYLASDAACFCTGSDMVVDGGYSLY
jgi:NAD(P)-dependent dehydrogenase (short-subunit alcohol dehydrogenase family)